jgi:hypothetical protein
VSGPRRRLLISVSYHRETIGSWNRLPLFAVGPVAETTVCCSVAIVGFNLTAVCRRRLNESSSAGDRNADAGTRAWDSLQTGRGTASRPGCACQALPLLGLCSELSLVSCCCSSHPQQQNPCRPRSPQLCPIMPNLPRRTSWAPCPQTAEIRSNSTVVDPARKAQSGLERRSLIRKGMFRIPGAGLVGGTAWCCALEPISWAFYPR